MKTTKFYILLIITFIFGSTFKLNAQLSELEAKSLLFNRITELSEFEGIFDIKSVFVNAYACNSERELIINDRIAIIKIDNQLKVMSLIDRQEIGYIALRYQNGYYGELITNGFSKYPNLKITSVWWDTELKYNEDYHYFAHKQLINEINRLKNYWPAWCREYAQYGGCVTSIKYRLDRVFPNKNEPPPSTTSSGTGIIISKQGHVITNKHVVEKTNYVWNDRWPVSTWIIDDSENSRSYFNSVSTSLKGLINGVEYDLVPVAMVDKITSTFIEIDEDLIILKIVTPPSDLKYSILDLNPPGLGLEVYALGYPLSSTLDRSIIYSNGYFSSQSAGFDIYNMSINPGNSGGGIFSKANGNLLGIATARVNDDLVGVKTEAICFGTRLDGLTKIIKSETTGFCELKRAYSSVNGYFWDLNQAYNLYYKPQFSMLVRDNSYRPILTIENNKQATIQIIAQ